ncbi:rhodanese-like domain-containing protein [Pseudodesulfovibrio sp. zrk46]|uniref:rhodanese-like domain-containing protein n=1 Tax=Pseudodesulfovibrio sp. zrk46 TaxID=2725288 RepID=UPI001449E3D0|nr:rhodanese-like domain-containing protein [Pseudodesulfovibrio sp. zrk46]QJB55011.1 rhodanese-like domain-containing protein [Pseudodesulfovibrio sp. zrk46]
MNQKIVIPVVILLVAGMLFFFNMAPTPEGYTDFQAVEAQEQLNANKAVVVLDIRTPAEFNSGHIPGAVNVDFYSKDFEAELSKLDKNAQYFVYCRTGNRSSSALKLMHKLGFTKVWHLYKGIVDWKGAGLPLEN